jgi:diguanylate cyclase (GGDEF)-like protein
MSCSPEELQKKSDDFLAKWKSFAGNPGFDDFVEFAVAASSLTEFLNARGLSGLHQSAHALEQKALSMFDGWNSLAMPGATLADLSVLTAEFGARVVTFIQGSSPAPAERRTQPDHDLVTDLTPSKKIWFVTSAPQNWSALVTQLGYYNVQVGMSPLHGDQAIAVEPAIVLVDAEGLEHAEFCAAVESLRGRFSASNIIGLNLPNDFESFNLALGVGCDFCFAVATPPSAIMARIVKLCDNEEEPPYRVLVVEDSKTASTVIQRTLSECGIESLAIARPQQVLTSLAKFQPDLILMDMYMPGCTGVEVTRVIRQHAAFLSTPVVYLSGDTNVALQVDALRLGGDHFLTKPFNPVILNAVVKSKIDRYRALRRSMFLDSLTGLFNHITSKQRLDAAVSTALQEGTPLAVAMLDIDHFKKVNDSYGHPMGDQVIRSMAWLLKQRLRKTDTIGRYGGEEFLVILPGSSAEQARQLLEAIRVDFGHIRHPVQDLSFACTFSGGVAQWSEGMCTEALIKKADEVLYQAKRYGRNQVVV